MFEENKMKFQQIKTKVLIGACAAIFFLKFPFVRLKQNIIELKQHFRKTKISFHFHQVKFEENKTKD